jgi:GNAT superfamily N-acetyltransferase
MAEVAAPRPLAEDDDRARFDCGRESLNEWFRRHAWHNHASRVSRTSVICDIGTGLIAGYVTLSAAQIEREFLAKADQRNKPDPVPVTLLGQLAVNQAHQRQGHARSLLLFALTTALRLSREIGSFGVITHPIDDQLRRFYAQWGFQNLPFDPRHAMIVRTDLPRHTGGHHHREVPHFVWQARLD